MDHRRLLIRSRGISSRQLLPSPIRSRNFSASGAGLTDRYPQIRSNRPTASATDRHRAKRSDLRAASCGTSATSGDRGTDLQICIDKRSTASSSSSESTSSASSSSESASSASSSSTTDRHRYPKLAVPMSLASLLLDAAEKACVKALHPDHAIHSSARNSFLYYLHHPNFGPVPECPPISNLLVLGHLPSCLNGEFLRIGPNPRFEPLAGYHWFDGDGMIHGVRIKDGKATYACRYVQTSRLKQEEAYGSPKFGKVGDLKGIFTAVVGLFFALRCLFKVVDPSRGLGTANTSMVYHGGRLLALYEIDIPYAVRIMEDGDLRTLGPIDYEKRLTHPFTAHPKIDPVTGELFTFGYQLVPPDNCCSYRVVSKDGTMGERVGITLMSGGASMMHDFAITEHYAVFIDIPLSLQPQSMLKGEHVIRIDCAKPTRIGILPRYASDESAIQWFELPPCYVSHTANAWEEGDEVVLYACVTPHLAMEIFLGLGPAEIESRRELMSIKIELYEMRFNLKSGEASQKRLSALPGHADFPLVNDKYIGRKQQFVYCACTSLKEPTKIYGLAKFDLWVEPDDRDHQLAELIDDDTGDRMNQTRIETGGNVKGVIHFGSGKYGSEAVFVPRLATDHHPFDLRVYLHQDHEPAEDDGYLLCLVHDEANMEASELHVYDAQTMCSEPVAIVKLPRRVPYGFHALFVTEEQLESQRTG